MHVLLTTHGSHGDFEAMTGPAVQFQTLGAEARI
jgi:hypothetical protein